MNSAEHELKRLKASRDYINTTTDNDLDLITDLVSRVCQVPITLITLIDETKIIFESNVGLGGISELLRENSFFDRVIE